MESIRKLMRKNSTIMKLFVFGQYICESSFGYWQIDATFNVNVSAYLISSNLIKYQGYSS